MPVTLPKYLVTLIIVSYFAALKLDVFFFLLLKFSPIHSVCLIVLLLYMLCLCVHEILAVLLPRMVELCYVLLLWTTGIHIRQ